MQTKGSIRIKTRLIKSIYEDVPASIEFSVVRSAYEAGKGARPKSMLFLGRLNGWLTDPKYTGEDVIRAKLKYGFHRLWRAHDAVEDRANSLRSFQSNAELKIESLLKQGMITEAEKEKLSAELSRKMPK